MRKAQENNFLQAVRPLRRLHDLHKLPPAEPKRLQQRGNNIMVENDCLIYCTPHYWVWCDSVEHAENWIKRYAVDEQRMLAFTRTGLFNVYIWQHKQLRTAFDAWIAGYKMPPRPADRSLYGQSFLGGILREPFEAWEPLPQQALEGVA